MLKPPSLLIAVFIAAAVHLLGSASFLQATISPADRLSVTMLGCNAANRASARLTWDPPGSALQWVDLSLQNDNFSSSFSGSGPFAPTVSQVTLTELVPGTTYYARVTALSGSFWLISETLPFAAGCVSGETTNGHATSLQISTQQCLSDGSVRSLFVWTPSGHGPQWLDVSLTDNDFASGFAAAGPLGSSTSSFDWSGLTPASTHFARVNTLTPSGWRPSATVGFTTSACALVQFTPPQNPRARAVSTTALRFQWEKGNDNYYFCVDTALSLGDLLSFQGSWANHACGAFLTSAAVSGFQCGTLYYWRVWALGFTGSGHSPVVTVTTPGCAAVFEGAPIEDVTILTTAPGVYVARIRAGLPDGCTTSGFHDVSRAGNVIQISVYNFVTRDRACALVYSTYTIDVALPGDFVAGVTYVVNINEKTISFTPA